MRTDADVLRLGLLFLGRVEIDLERLESDPVWRSIISTAPDLRTGLQEYILHYTLREKLFTYMPCTNGPGSLELKEIIEENHADESGTKNS